jgi:hypothetical protein
MTRFISIHMNLEKNQNILLSKAKVITNIHIIGVSRSKSSSFQYFLLPPFYIILPMFSFESRIARKREFHFDRRITVGRQRKIRARH